jgi:hypothetical protein
MISPARHVVDDETIAEVDAIGSQASEGEHVKQTSMCSM